MEQEHKPLFMSPNDTPEESVDKEGCQVTNCGKRQWRPLLTTNALADITPLFIPSLFFLSGKPKSLPRSAASSQVCRMRSLRSNLRVVRASKVREWRFGLRRQQGACSAVVLYTAIPVV